MIQVPRPRPRTVAVWVAAIALALLLAHLYLGHPHDMQAQAAGDAMDRTFLDLLVGVGMFGIFGWLMSLSPRPLFGAFPVAILVFACAVYGGVRTRDTAYCQAVSEHPTDVTQLVTLAKICPTGVWADGIRNLGGIANVVVQPGGSAAVLNSLQWRYGLPPSTMALLRVYQAPSLASQYDAEAPLRTFLDSNVRGRPTAHILDGLRGEPLTLVWRAAFRNSLEDVVARSSSIPLSHDSAGMEEGDRDLLHAVLFAPDVQARDAYNLVVPLQ